MPRVNFDFTVSIAHLLQVGAILAALWLGVERIERRITILETKLDPLWQQYTGGMRPVQLQE